MMSRLAIFAWLITCGLCPSPSRSADDRFETDVFTSGTGGYHTYRIPSLLVTPKGALLAICEGRKADASDDGDIDLVVRRSADDGRTWGQQEVLYYYSAKSSPNSTEAVR